MPSSESWKKVTKKVQFFNLFNYYVGGFTINMSTYFCWLIIPLLMKENGATPFDIGLADAVTFGITGLLSPLIGFVASKEYLCPDTICRIGFVLQATCSISIAIYYISGTMIVPIFFLLVQESFALAFFWSICEYLLSNEIYQGETNQKMSWFCCSWSFGKAIGFVLGGPMRSAFGYSFSLYFSALIVMIAFVVFPRMPRNRSTTPNTAKLEKQKAKLEKKKAKKIESLTKKGLSQEEIEIKINNMHKENFLTKHQPVPKRYFLYYLNELVIHFTVYGTVAVFGNQYIDFADENNIVLNGVNDDSGTYCSLFLGIVYFSQSFCFWVLGQFSYWQYKQTLNIIVQIFIGAICLALIYLRNGWVLCVLAIPIGIISGYDLQSNVLYSINAGPKIKGVILGMSECVGELTCCLCPLFAGLIATQTDDRKWALWFGLILQCVGIVLCIITQAITIILERFDKQKESDEIELGNNEYQEPTPIEDVDVDTNLVHQIEIEDGNVSESSELDKEEDTDEKSPEENENVQPTGTPEQKPSNE
ncbi:major facilitator superfamily protein [Entamoeba histolytica]|uniref:Major facilitator superfamily protein n=8 Tax=Entamoeba histolytica TaxID=5759 RepID=B1N3K6_ENTH1|nr:major facilitator superfamily transporter [Entamoeba histolytica HM-1:IMSS]EDS89453.1 major facilitator superfamily protein [Entamoeba histolytica HM-1:IMSS]GAT95874.1 major facilitator superfamily protein [Entamoeba histolytica]|eukprot:XP_001913772.1 major facilitator superfamily transporter [Entamoeba histolytica HM-1:IMSS]